jgi:predicted secreted protein
MTLTLGIAIYIMTWWITLFAVLPIGVKTQGEDGDVVAGTPASAPVKPRLLRVIVINTVVATAAFLVVWAAFHFDWLGLHQIPSSLVAPELR